MKSTTVRRVIAATALMLTAPAALPAQWSRVSEQFYLPRSHNWVFRAEHPAADRLFNAFDYGHAILYEVLWSRPGAPRAILEQSEYTRITRHLLVNPPKLPLEEAAIAPHYSRLVPEARVMFEWAHLLHRQLYDILADNRLNEAQRDGEVARVLAYYRSRPDLAFSTRPKSMTLMEGQPYSLAFRRAYPKFNGLIWAYHWLQVGLYDALLAGGTPDERATLVSAAVARFRQMLDDAPRSTPYVMPMTAAVAPVFTQRYPEAAAIFDNLHSMHDVISDVLANEAVPRNRKRAEILLAAQRYRDDSTDVMTHDAWIAMATGMGIENQGGPVVGVLSNPPVPTVELGAVMRLDIPAGGDPHAGHRMPLPSVDTARGIADSLARSGLDDATRERLADALFRLLEDSAVLARVRADSALRQALQRLAPLLPEAHRSHFTMMLGPPTVRDEEPST
jgi:hypothetical protein